MKRTVIKLSIVLACIFQSGRAEVIDASAAKIEINPSQNDSIYAEHLLARLEEIKLIDKSELSFAEKRELRKEVRTIRSELKAISGGVYLSATAIIIILLALILIL
ncbi:MAG: hypothetical protein ACHQNT_03750 [Bacteroidia bacterium]